MGKSRILGSLLIAFALLFNLTAPAVFSQAGPDASPVATDEVEEPTVPPTEVTEPEVTEEPSLEATEEPSLDATEVATDDNSFEGAALDTVYATLTGYTCNPNHWRFQITNTTGTLVRPAAITVTWSNGVTLPVLLDTAGSN
ncbi:MAG TPA: hypothetical protein VNP95_03385, partial [Thermomicrobiales bacterium]|nr:hypothetical protein [Thermomicrobiales bacterium]